MYFRTVFTIKMLLLVTQWNRLNFCKVKDPFNYREGRERNRSSQVLLKIWKFHRKTPVQTSFKKDSNTGVFL